MSEEKSFSASSYWFQQSLKAHIDRDIAKRNKAMDETELQQSKKPANNKRPTFEDYCFEPPVADQLPHTDLEQKCGKLLALNSL